MTRTLSPNENQGIAGPPIGWVPPADGAVDCSIYLFESGVITDAGRMFGATLGTIVLGIAEQGLGHVRRHKIKSWVAKAHGRVALELCVYALQTTAAYFLMLVAMSYSVPLFFGVVLGLALGHMIFNYDPDAPVIGASRRTRDDANVPMTGPTERNSPPGPVAHS